MTQCPHCNKEINLGSLVVKNRWKGTTKEERSEAMRKLATGNENWKKRVIHSK